jgi:hypothetical protein
MHTKHLLLCAAVAIVVGLLLVDGASAALLVFPLACAAMMVGMLWMMARPGGHDGD